MKISINIEVELSEEELDFLKEKFLLDRNKPYNINFEKSNSGTNSKYSIMKTLLNRSIINIDKVGNSLPTQVGNKILDLFDRDKKITNLLNDTES